ncbi:MAG: hypothetical protein Q9222_000016 [Ikaeria aurantiellina]
MGTCESLAQTAVQSAAHHGFLASVKPLDGAAKKLPRDQPILIITSSYEGEPPDAAKRFISWLKRSDLSDLSNVHYAMFGCGNMDWKEIYQCMSTMVDALLEAKHAKRLAARGCMDAGKTKYSMTSTSGKIRFFGLLLTANMEVAKQWAILANGILSVGFVNTPSPRPPLAGSNFCALTCRVLADTFFQEPTKKHLGVALNFLSGLKPGDHIHVSVKAGHDSFHLPGDKVGTPIVMICAGTGIALFRVLVQERTIQIPAGQRLAHALLFMGCRQPQSDDVYRESLQDWAGQGAVNVRYAYSQQPESSNGAKYVQHRLWDDREEVMELYGKGANEFIWEAEKSRTA